MSLFDADAFKSELYKMNCIDDYGWAVVPLSKINIALEKSAIDAVPVARCKTCRHAKKISGGLVRCSLFGWMIHDFFCGLGERKDDG